MVPEGKRINRVRDSWRVLVAGPCVSEFGWELMCWQGLARKLAQGYDWTVLCSSAGLEPLYADFCDQFIAHIIGGFRDCWFLRDSAVELAQAKNELARVAEKFRSCGASVDEVAIEGFIPGEPQSFIRYGSGWNSVPETLRFDVVLHARWKQSHNPVSTALNWPQLCWDRLSGALLARGLRVACIGTRIAALHPRGTIDLRGLALNVVCDVMSSAGVVAGPSSGPLHLASLCGARHVVWTLSSNTSAWKAWGTSRQRYEHLWNPFGVCCRVIEAAGDTKPDMDLFLAAIIDSLE